jgi:uncharacterized membrane protein YdjX (TVP38/TMEM64 family)
MKGGLKLIEYEMWRYRYLVLFTISVIFAVFILSSQEVVSLLSKIGEWGYFGAFVTGAFYTYSISSPPAAATFFVISHGLNPFIAAALGGLGAMLGDFVIFKLIKTEILPEARLLAKDLKVPRIKSHKLVHLIHKIAPFIAGFIIASPLPDEIGAAMFGAIEYNTKKFMIISWICNTSGLLMIALLGNIF